MKSRFTDKSGTAIICETTLPIRYVWVCRTKFIKNHLTDFERNGILCFDRVTLKSTSWVIEQMKKKNKQTFDIKPKLEYIIPQTTPFYVDVKN